MKSMRTTFRIFAAAAFAALGILTSCQEQGLVPFSDSKELVPVTLTASFVQTKVSYTPTSAKNLKPSWEADDKVIGFDGNNNTYEFTVTDVNATSGAATLTGTAPANCTLHLIYLCGAAKGDITSGSLSVSYDGQAGDNTIPAVMLADGKVTFGSGDFHFSNAGAVIGIDAVKGVPNGSTISKITVFGDNLAAANIALNDSKLALTATEAVGESISTGTLTGVTVTDEAGTLNNTVFIAVPAGAKVSKVSLDVESKTYSYELNAPESLTANQYTYVSGKKFKSKIKASFSTACIKPTPESPQPEFVGGEVIKISNGTSVEECTVAVEDGIAYITPTLTGTLTAVYPASAWSDSEPYFKVPTHQDGTFASANICMAEIAETATEAIFVNQTAVFKITPGAGTSTTFVDVIAPHDKVLADYVPEGSKFNCDSYHKIHVSVSSGDDVYVSIQVPEDLSLNSITFADNSGIKTPTSSDEVAVNSLYTVTAENWGRPYVEIGGVKWATMNIGATTVAGCRCTCYGDYFAWGETEPYYESFDWTQDDYSKFTFKETYSTGYNWSNYKYCNGTGTTLTKYCNIPDYGYEAFTDTKTVLEPADDAATYNWGSSWRMPTIEDFQSLFLACNCNTFEYSEITDLDDIEEGGVYWSENYYGVRGILFVDAMDTSKRVFFPITGYVLGTYHEFGAPSVYYLSSSLDVTFHPDQIVAMLSYPFEGGFGMHSRDSGNPVRAVSD